MNSSDYKTTLNNCEWEFYSSDGTIDYFINKLTEYKNRGFAYMSIHDDSFCFYNEETDDERSARLEEERIAKEKRETEEKSRLETKRKKKQIKELQLKMKKLEKLINNKNFVDNANPQVVTNKLKELHTLTQEWTLLKLSTPPSVLEP